MGYLGRNVETRTDTSARGELSGRCAKRRPQRIERTEHEVVLLVFRGGAFPLPQAPRTRGPAGATRSSGGASRTSGSRAARRQEASAYQGETKGSGPAPQIRSPSRLGCSTTPARPAHRRSPSSGGPIKSCGGSSARRSRPACDLHKRQLIRSSFG
jgi:hypothetical protein